MGKIQQFKQRVNNAVSGIKDLPRNTLLSTFENEIKLRQLKWTAKGSPITEAELTADLTSDWKITGFVYRKAGITLEDLIEIGKKAIADPSGAVEQPKTVQRIANIVGRNAPCPCGSGKKYKKCCGKGE